MINNELRYKDNLPNKAVIIIMASIHFIITVCGIALMIYSLLSI